MKDDPQASLRRSMKFRRLQLGLTQEDVAKLLDVSRLTYLRMEAGLRRIEFPMIAKICGSFNFSVNDMIDDRTVSHAYRIMAKRILKETSM